MWTALSESIPELIAALRRGEAPARVRLWRGHRSALVARAQRVLGDAGDAEDVAAGVLADFMGRLVHRFRGETAAALRAYLVAATIDRSLRLRDRGKVVAIEAGLEDTRAAPEAEAHDPWLDARLRECVRRLPAEQRAVLRLRYAADLDNVEIAELLGQSRSAVSQRLIHPRRGALARLRRCLSRKAGEAGAARDRPVGGGGWEPAVAGAGSAVRDGRVKG